MLEPFKSPRQIGRPSRRSDRSAILNYDTLLEAQSKSDRTTIYDLERKRQRELFWRRILSLWPFLLGLILGCFAPQLRHTLTPIEPWGAWLVFPFAVLAGRPEFHLTGDLARIIPLVALYAQFPIEGLLVRLILRHRVTVPGVAREMFLFHFLGAMELCLITGVVMPFLVRLR